MMPANICSSISSNTVIKHWISCYILFTNLSLNATIVAFPVIFVLVFPVILLRFHLVEHVAVKFSCQQ
jgi:hypothetical protein